MRWPRPLLLGCTLLAALGGTWRTAHAETGVLAFTGETLHAAALDPLLAFGYGRTVSTLPHMASLALHAADDDDIVILLLESGVVTTADDDLRNLILYDESDIGRDVAKLLGKPGGALLFETLAGNATPASALYARHLSPTGETLTLHLDAGVRAVPEPSRSALLVAGAGLLLLLGRHGNGLWCEANRGGRGCRWRRIGRPSSGCGEPCRTWTGIR
jgi:hypothetical protein